MDAEGGSVTFNPYLAGLKTNAAEPAKGGSGNIERPQAVENIPWQTRPAELTAFEMTLAAALQAMFRKGVEALPDIVARLNAAAVQEDRTSVVQGKRGSVRVDLGGTRSII